MQSNSPQSAFSPLVEEKHKQIGNIRQRGMVITFPYGTQFWKPKMENVTWKQRSSYFILGITRAVKEEEEEKKKKLKHKEYSNQNVSVICVRSAFANGHKEGVYLTVNLI